MLYLLLVAALPAYAAPYDLTIDLPSWVDRYEPSFDVRDFRVVESSPLLEGEGIIDLHAKPAVAPVAPTVAPTVRTHEDHAAVAVEVQARES